jgi:hypothetical protein
MNITHEQLDMLSRIYNAMCEIRTSGQDTMTMADCLRALESIVTQIARSAQAPATAESEGEE